MSTKRRIAAGLVGTCVLLAGCNSTTDTDDGSNGGDGADTTGDDYGGVTELSLYSGWNKGTPLGDMQEKVLEQYTEETGIEVTVSDAVGDSMREAYEAQVAAGEQADLVIINPTDRTRDWVKNGALVDAQQYVDSWGLADKMTDTALEGWTDTEGNLIGIPYVGFEWPIYWNTKVLADAGVDEIPTTDEEMYAAAEKLEANDIPLFVTGGGDWTGGAFFYHTMNAYAEPETMKQVWQEGGYCDTPEVKKGIEYFVTMRDSGVFIDDVEGYMQDQQNQTFFTGQAAAMSGGSWWFEDVPEEMRTDVELGGIPVPEDAHYDKPLATRGSTSNGFMISEKGTEKEAAIRKLVEMYFSQDIASEVVTETSTVSVVKLDPAPEPENVLLDQALNELPDKVGYVPMVDFEIPAPIQAQSPTTTAQVYSSEQTADDICQTLDSLY